MRCPYCGATDDKVLDSREAPDATSIKRRRECKGCQRRFTTFEQIEEITLYVVKSDVRREPFDRAKVLRGVQLASTGRGIEQDALNGLVEEIERILYNRQEREVSTADIGEMVMERLQALDSVAYVRFASVYYQFEDALQFRDIVTKIRRRSKRAI